MESLIALPDPKKKVGNTALLAIKVANKKNPISKSVKKPYYKFYKVFKNETSVTAVFVNDFKTFKPTFLKIKTACALSSAQHPAFCLPADDYMFHGFLSRIRAMEYAKAGALKYISKLIDDGEKGYELLLKYRDEHYEDLNINLTDKNIRKLEEIS